MGAIGLHLETPKSFGPPTGLCLSPVLQANRWHLPLSSQHCPHITGWCGGPRVQFLGFELGQTLRCSLWLQSSLWGRSEAGTLAELTPWPAFFLVPVFPVLLPPLPYSFLPGAFPWWMSYTHSALQNLFHPEAKERDICTPTQCLVYRSCLKKNSWLDECSPRLNGTAWHGGEDRWALDSLQSPRPWVEIWLCLAVWLWASYLPHTSLRLTLNPHYPQTHQELLVRKKIQTVENYNSRSYVASWWKTLVRESQACGLNPVSPCATPVRIGRWSPPLITRMRPWE